MSRSSMSMSSSQNKSSNKNFMMSSYSLNRSSLAPMNRIAKDNLKEELISKKITEIFKEKETRMIRTIEHTIFDDKLKIYKMKRAEFEEELSELEKEKIKIIKRKKNKKERIKALRVVTRQQVAFIVRALNQTIIHYKTLYFENDFYRLKRLLDVANVEKTEAAKNKTVQELLNNFFHSPFKDDKRFMIRYLAVETRDRLSQSKHLIDALFFDKIFKILLNSSDEQNCLQAYDIICNLISNADYRARIRDKGYLSQIYESINLDKIDERKLEKISHLTTLIAYHTDMLQRIIDIKLMAFIIKLMDSRYNVTIRSNAVQAISMLTYHEILFQELISNGVIDMIMEICMDPFAELSIKRFSTLTLVHFALSKDSIKLLLDKGIMNLFNILSIIENVQIQTNVSWIFLALCNNGITGKQMLHNGITRDMFLISCNPQFSQIRHLVIAGFAELGRSENLQEHHTKVLSRTLQRIKEQAIFGTQEAFKKEDAPHTIDVLLRFSLSNESSFKVTAYQALKDYIFLNHEDLIDDLKGIICAFVNGAAEKDDKVKAECANAISFLITHHMVFTAEEAKQRIDKMNKGNHLEYEYKEDMNYILDALMYLTGHDILDVRTRAFSTLSSLSTYASTSEDVMTQIQHDIKMRPGQSSQNYFNFIEERIAKSQATFRRKFETANIEKEYAGLYCLLRLAHEPDEVGTEEAARYLKQFYFPDLDLRPLNEEAAHRTGPNITVAKEDESELPGESQNAVYAEHLTEAEKRLLSVNMFNDELDQREIQLDELNEKFFISVFKALLFTKNRRILYQLLDVINFYIMHETPYQKEIINPSTILWMLQIIDTHQQDHDLCLLSAKTILKVVKNHQIMFDYQEMAIIKKFNKALDNLGEYSRDFSPDKSSDKSQKSNSSLGLPKSSKSAVEIQVPLRFDQLTVFREQIGSQQDDQRNSQQIRQSNTPRSMKEMKSNEDIIKTIQVGQLDETHKQSAGSFDSDQMSKEIENFSKAGISQQTSQEANDKDVMAQSIRSLSQMQSNRSFKQIQEENLAKIEKILSQEDAVSPLSPRDSKQKIKIFGRNTPQLTSKNGQLSLSNEKPTHLSQREVQNVELRDVIIKSFMVIFTNEKSQHLLLNKDIIEIAFSCLENVFQISSEATCNLARLISIIFKFPQVQERLSNEGVILGIVYLLQMKDIHNGQTLSHLVQACSYISLNFQFVNSKLSLHILQALVPILDRLLQIPEPQHLRSNLMKDSGSGESEQFEHRLSMQIKTPIDKRPECDNCIFAISNLLKGHPENTRYFIQCDGAKLILHEILRIKYNDTVMARELLELTMSCLQRITEQKDVFMLFLSFSKDNLNLLPACLQKCFSISDQWHTCTSEILLFKKLFKDGEMRYNGQDAKTIEKREADKKKNKRLDSDAIQNIDYKNIERLKQLEKLEEKEDKSFIMAPLCKLRNYCYQISVSCIRAGFSQKFLLEQCAVLNRIIEDLKKEQLNDFIFQNLLDILKALKKDKQAIRTLFQDHALTLIQLINSMQDEPIKRLSIIKTMIYLILRAPEELMTIDSAIFGQFFKLATDLNDDEVTENILWLQTSLVEINSSPEQHLKGIEMCTEFKSAYIYAKCIKSQNEVIVLQALKGLKSLAEIPQFKAIILIDIGEDLFPDLAQILSTRLKQFTLCPLEIEVELIGFLAKITESSAATKDPLTVAAKRRAVQQGFMEHFLVRISTIDYVVLQDIDMLNDNCAAISNLDLLKLDNRQRLHSSANSSQDAKGRVSSIEMKLLEEGGDFQKVERFPKYDKIEREQSTNRLVENTIDLAANVTELAETHHDLVHGRGKILSLTTSLIRNVVQQCDEVESEQVDMLYYSIGNRQICNSLSKILLNLCLSLGTHQQGAPSIQDICVSQNIGGLLVHVCHSLVDYELHSNLYRAMCVLGMSPNQENRTHFIESECLNEVQLAAENSRYFRVRRACTKALDEVSSELFEMNEKMNRKKRKAQRKQHSLINIQAKKQAA